MTVLADGDLPQLYVPANRGPQPWDWITVEMLLWALGTLTVLVLAALVMATWALRRTRPPHVPVKPLSDDTRPDHEAVRVAVAEVELEANRRAADEERRQRFQFRDGV